MSEKRNKSFLLAINNILGGRKKHPWGRAIGLKNTRINDIFAGKIPSADALLKIHRAENVRVDYLLTGEGPPYSVPDIRDDSECRELLEAYLSKSSWKVYLLTTESRDSLVVVLTSSARDEYGNGDIAHYTRVEVLPYVGHKTLELLNSLDQTIRIVTSNNLTLERLSRGWLGPLFLLGDDENKGELSNAISLSVMGMQGSIDRFLNTDKEPQKDEAELVSYYRRLEPNVKNALLTMAKTMTTEGRHNVMQPPPGGIIHPDTKATTESKGKGKASRTHGKKSTTDKI